MIFKGMSHRNIPKLSQVEHHYWKRGITYLVKYDSFRCEPSD